MPLDQFTCTVLVALLNSAVSNGPTAWVPLAAIVTATSAIAYAVVPTLYVPFVTNVAVTADAEPLVISMSDRPVLVHSLPLPESTGTADASTTPDAAVVTGVKGERAMVLL